MKFMLVNGRNTDPQSSCALCCEPIGETYLRKSQPGSPIVTTSATSVTVSWPPAGIPKPASVSTRR